MVVAVFAQLWEVFNRDWKQQLLLCQPYSPPFPSKVNVCTCVCFRVILVIPSRNLEMATANGVELHVTCCLETCTCSAFKDKRKLYSSWSNIIKLIGQTSKILKKLFLFYFKNSFPPEIRPCSCSICLRFYQNHFKSVCK